MPDVVSRAQRRVFVGFTVCAALLLGVGGLEVGLRVLWDGFYLKEPKSYAAPDAVRGWKNRPNAKVDYGEPEFSIVVEHNSLGYRSPEISREKPPGRFRILALGDSMTYGIGVENDETFCAVLGQLDPRLEVINAGANGYGTSQELLVLREEGLGLRPDLVLVAFFWNDLGDSYTREFPAFSFEDGELVYPKPLSDAKLARAEALPRKRPVQYALRHSYAYRFLSDRIKIVRYAAKDALGVAVEEADVPEEERRAAWDLEFALLREIDRLGRGIGAETLIVIIPDQVQVESDVRVVGLLAEEYEIQAKLLDFAKRSGIPALDLLQTLRSAYELEGVPLYYRYDRHMKAHAHAITARAIYAEIERLGLLGGSADAG